MREHLGEDTFALLLEPAVGSLGGLLLVSWRCFGGLLVSWWSVGGPFVVVALVVVFVLVAVLVVGGLRVLRKLSWCSPGVRCRVVVLDTAMSTG